MASGQQYIEQICNEVASLTRRDGDVGWNADNNARCVSNLLSICDIAPGTPGTDDLYMDSDYSKQWSSTYTIVDEWVCFTVEEFPGQPLGGSLSDYCASAAKQAFLNLGFVIRVADVDAFRSVMVPALGTALYPQREITHLSEAMGIRL